MRMWLRAFSLSMAILFLAAAVGCNTFRGMGRDIQRGGEAIEDAAESTGR